jgi:Arc/MetJ-type ribon-helix-helix transcriptional regulator
MPRIKKTVSISLSPYVLEKLEANTGEGRRFATSSDAVNTALIELFHRLEICELAKALEYEKCLFEKEKREEKNESEK